MNEIDRVYNISKKITSMNIVAVNPIIGGGNNRLFCLTVETGDKLAFKFYPNENRETRPRLLQEFQAISFMASNGIKSIPLPIAYDAIENCAIYTWLEGSPVGQEFRQTDLTEMVSFLKTIQLFRNKKEADNLKNASAAVFSMSQVISQLEMRYENLLHTTVSSPIEDLHHYLQDIFRSTKTTLILRAHKIYKREDICISSELLHQNKVLSPSDFGRHNVLRNKSGHLMFLDFEYFGWDDPAKLISDVILHPGSQFSSNTKMQLEQMLIDELLFIDPNLTIRYDALFPIFGLIWCLIILNCFLPNGQHRQSFANRTENFDLFCEQQLQKSKNLMNEMREYAR